jgi:hypothetical protein
LPPGYTTFRSVNRSMMLTPNPIALIGCWFFLA